jgi:hypothetical protein
MENQDEFKSIRVVLSMPTEKGEFAPKEVRITVNTLKRQEKDDYWSKGRRTYEMSFSIKLPDYIYEKLKGSVVPNTTVGGNRDLISYPLDMPKTIKSESISGITELWQRHANDYLYLVRLDNAVLTKTIFYEFAGNIREFSCNWAGYKLGVKADMSYRYFIGFISDDGKLRLNSEKRTISGNSNNREFEKMPYVEWTQEREDFFVGLQKSYESMIARVAEFEASINNDSIDALILNSPLMKQLGA